MPLRVSSPAGARSNQGVGLDIDLSNPLLGHNSSSRNDTVFVPRTASETDSNAGSGWLEFDLGELEDDSHPEEDRSKLPKA